SQPYSSVPSSASLVESEGGQSRRSRSALATSLAPRSLVEGMTPSAMPRRTVLIDIPVSRAMSAARRYSVPRVMTACPKGGEGAPGGRPVGAAEPSRGRLAVQEGERTRAEQRQSPARALRQSVNELTVCPGSYARAKLFRNGVETCTVGEKIA